MNLTRTYDRRPPARPVTATLRRSALGALAVLGAIGTLAGCSGADGSPADGAERLSIVGYSVLESANKPILEEFQGADETGIQFRTSYGASGDQSRAVEGGLEADIVHLSLEPDIARLVDAGLVADDWKDTSTKGIVTSSVVSFVVRKGNPENIQGWDDLVRPGVEIITPNPASSGSAKWNILGAWGHAIQAGGDEADATAFVAKFLANTIALPGSGREATTAFAEGNGDVLISYENEAILARANGEPFDYVVPDDTLLIENPAVVTKDAAPGAQDFYDFLLSTQAQADYATFGFRPVVDGVELPEIDGVNDPSNPFPAPAKLLTIDDDFGGWAQANSKFFDENDGIITRLQAEAGAAQ